MSEISAADEKKADASWSFRSVRFFSSITTRTSARGLIPLHPEQSAFCCAAAWVWGDDLVDQHAV